MCLESVRHGPNEVRLTQPVPSAPSPHSQTNVPTRLILTPLTATPRTILSSLRLLPSYILPTTLAPITALHSILPTLISASTPLVLRSTLRVDPILTPAAYSLASFLSSTLELFLKLPLETVLRRAQVAHWRAVATHAAQTSFRTHSRGRRSHERRRPESVDRGEERTEVLPTVVDIGPWKGVLGSLWFIVREEGARPASSTAKGLQEFEQGRNIKKGQGVRGLWRGWRVGFWGLVGVWGAAALGGSGASGGEF